MHVSQLDAKLKEKKAAAKALLESTMRAAAEHVVTPASATAPAVIGRAMTAEEKGAIQALLDDAKSLQARIDGTRDEAAMQAEIDRLMGSGTLPTPTPADGTRELRSLGAQFVADERYRRFIAAGAHRTTGAWTSPAVDLQATTFDTTSGSGGALIQPDVRPGIVELKYKRLVVADLIAPGTTDSNTVSFMKETTFTNAAAAVAQGGTKPESTLVFAPASSKVEKVAHWIPVTDEMLEDFAQTRSIIDSRLRLGLSLTEEDELLNGNGTSPHLLGLMNLPGLSTAQARGTDSNVDALFKQISAIATTTFITPEGIIINPINWQAIQLMKDANGNYVGAGPFAAAQTPYVWGLPVAPTPSIVANTALVGAFQSCAQIFRKGGVRVEASNSHASFFITNLVAIRAEERLALAVYREPAFGKVTGLN